MSTFDDASLVFIPSGYKTSKAYSVKPIDGSGDLTFTRSNDTATRVASNGLIEKVRTNLVLQSETFGNASWGKSLVTITDNFDTAPNGTLTADRFVSAGGAFPQIAQARTVVSGAQYTASLYVKSDGTTQIAQVLIIGGNTVSFTPTNTWQRITTTFTAASSSATFVLATNSAVAPASSFVIWGAQLETGDIATDYIPTTTAAVSVGPVANVPRLDYLNSSCPRLLLEPQRTNLNLFSEQLASQTLQNSPTITSNTAVSPDGYINADKLTPSNTNTFTGAVRTGIAAGTYTISMFAKANGKNWVFFYQIGGPTGPNGVWYNVSTGAIGTVGGSWTNAKIENYGNGWYRVSATVTFAAGGNYLYWLAADSNGNTTLSVNGSDGMLMWGLSYEAGAYATSYIPTLGAAVTRASDVCSKTGISSLIGQTEGTLFLDVVAQVDTAESQDFSISDGTANNRASIRLNNSGLINAVGVFGGSVQFSMGTGAYVTGQRYKIALAYKLNDVVLYVNGVQSATDTSATISGTLSRLGFDVNTTGTQNLKSRVNQALLFKTRLSNSDLAALTTL